MKLAGKPQEGCAFATVSMGEAEVLIEYEYEPGEAAKLYGPPEDCYEGTPETLTILQAFINGEWVDPVEFASEALFNAWEQAILAQVEDQRQADAEYRAEARNAHREFA
jgi:hypothetical protein